MIDSIKWYGHGTFCIDGSPQIVIDPWRVTSKSLQPDIILITHEHYDHCSPADVDKLRGENTVVIASRSAAEHLDGPVTVLRPWQVINFGRTSIKAVPAYTFTGNHPAPREDLGFVISRDYTDVYYAGDSDFIPEIRDMHCDIAMLPVAAKDGLMSAESAGEFARIVKPRYVIPSHLGSHAEGGGKLENLAFEREIADLTDLIRLPLAGSTTGNLFAFGGSS
jgi:L-ascorbate metabolism protein UlaG (beta-lactamase superfamily)